MVCLDSDAFFGCQQHLVLGSFLIGFRRYYCIGQKYLWDARFFQTVRRLWRQQLLEETLCLYLWVKVGLLCSEDVAHQNELTLMWVPGQHGISGNEVADRLASSSSLALNPFVSFLLSASQFREVVDVWECEEISLHWIEAPGLRLAERLITPLTVKVQSLMPLRRTGFRTLKGLFNGHCHLNYYF